MRPILGMVLEYGEFPEILRVADLLHARTGQSVVIQFVKPHYRRLAQDSAVVLAHGHAWMDAKGERHAAAAPAVVSGSEPVGSPSVAVPARPVRSAMREIAVDLINCVADLRRLRRRGRDMQRVILNVNPALLVVGQDSLAAELSFALQAAARARVPSLLVPFAMFNRKELVDYCSNQPELAVPASPLNRLAAWLFPRWVARDGAQPALRLRGSRVLAMELAGLCGGDPWTPCSEPVDAIACDSAVSVDSFARMGVPHDRLHVVGAPVHDVLAAMTRERREEWLREQGLDGSRPLLVCGWPVNMLAWLGARRSAFADYDTLAKFWAENLVAVQQRHGWNVLVCAHPKTLDSELSCVEAAGLSWLRGQTEAAVAACNLLTTLNGSSITAWAIACAKPVLLFDCFETGYDDFEGAPGCRLVTDKDAFIGQLNTLCADSAQRMALAAEQSRVARDWGLLDGHSADRLAALAMRLMDHDVAEVKDRAVRTAT